MGSYKYDLKVVYEDIGHEYEYLFIGLILENGVEIGKYEVPDYGGLPYFTFVSDEKEEEFYAYVVEVFGAVVGDEGPFACGVSLIEKLNPKIA